MKKLAVFLFLISIFDCTAVFADQTNSRPIVFSARYYLKPGSSGTSGVHIYRINPDGTGLTQITDSDNIDVDVNWSPDGKWIAFQRELPNTWAQSYVCVMNVSSGRIFKFLQTEDGHLLWFTNPMRLVYVQWGKNDTDQSYAISGNTVQAVHTQPMPQTIESPDKKWSFQIRDDNNLYVASNVSERPNSVEMHGDITSAIWLNANTLAYLTLDSTDPKLDYYPFTLWICTVPSNIDGQWTHNSYPISELARKAVGSESPDIYDIEGLDNYSVRPGHPNQVVIAMDEHNSTVGNADAYVLVTVHSGSPATVHLLVDYVSYFAWSPDGNSFVYSPGRDTAPYSKWHGGQTRYVWVAPMSVQDTEYGKRKMITPSLSDVINADWRP